MSITGRSGNAPFTVSGTLQPSRKYVDQVIRRQRFGEQVTLAAVTSQRAELSRLCRGLDSFGRDAQVEGLGKRHDAAHDRQGSRIGI